MRLLHFILKQQDILQERDEFYMFPFFQISLMDQQSSPPQQMSHYRLSMFYTCEGYPVHSWEGRVWKTKFSSIPYILRHAFPFSQLRDLLAQPYNIKYSPRPWIQTDISHTCTMFCILCSLRNKVNLMGLFPSPSQNPTVQDRVKLILHSAQGLLVWCKCQEFNNQPS